MSWKVGQRAMVIPDNVFDLVKAPTDTSGPFAGCYGHVLEVGDVFVRVRLEGTINHFPPKMWKAFPTWLFCPEEIEHAD